MFMCCSRSKVDQGHPDIYDMKIGSEISETVAPTSSDKRKKKHTSKLSDKKSRKSSKLKEKMGANEKEKGTSKLMAPNMIGPAISRKKMEKDDKHSAEKDSHRKSKKKDKESTKKKHRHEHEKDIEDETVDTDEIISSYSATNDIRSCKKHKEEKAGAARKSKTRSSKHKSGKKRKMKKEKSKKPKKEKSIEEYLLESSIQSESQHSESVGESEVSCSIDFYDKKIFGKILQKVIKKYIQKTKLKNRSVPSKFVG